MNDIDYYILKDRKPVAATQQEWSAWFNSRKSVAKTFVEDIRVSTVFLGMPHIGGMFETMIFNSPELCDYQTRCETWEEALVQHQEALDLLIKSL